MFWGEAIQLPDCFSKFNNNTNDNLISAEMRIKLINILFILNLEKEATRWTSLIKIKPWTSQNKTKFLWLDLKTLYFLFLLNSWM